MRVVCSLPIDMRANWIFRVAPVPAGPGCMIARRRALYGLSVVPVFLAAAALLFSIWPWQAAAKHLLVLALLGTTLAEVCLHGRQKLPFTARWSATRLANSEEGEVQFEEAAEPAIFALDLHRDGVTPIATASDVGELSR
jgi:hypothetical protein